MTGYGVKEARIDRKRQPDGNICGGCGDECTGLLCAECRVPAVTTEDEGEEARRTR